MIFKNIPPQKMAFSIILGLGVAYIFRKIYSIGNCVILKTPGLHELNENVFNENNKCYRFKSKIKKCVPNNKKVRFA